MSKKLPKGVYEFRGKIATKNSTPGYRVYGEKLVKKKGMEYRLWDPFRSKVGAALAKGLTSFPIKADSNILYLGASTGTTASHIADVTEGDVYCVEFSKRVARELMHVCRRKKNMHPIIADARHPWEYTNLVADADVLIQDVAQPRQAEILTVNGHEFNFKNALLSIKSRSIDSSKKPGKVIKEELAKLRDEYEILQQINLSPFEKDHALINLKRK